MTRYRNPVSEGYFADPFVLRTGGRYVAYGTGAVVDGRAFQVMVSEDLVTWTTHGGALELLDDPGLGTDYWAPEVAERDGRWWMYYSVGHDDVGHHLRVAVAEAPEGPFRDQGVDLTPDERFAIDPSPFQDADGQWYLYYARDVLQGDRVGTMLAVNTLPSPTALGDNPRTVLVPTDDWQLFCRDREMYGSVYDWHTLEGPFVHRHGDRYFCIYSGGAWTEAGYGVAYAVSDHPLGPWVEPSAAGRLLATVPGHVLGPGHCCIVPGPAGGDVLVYHAWDSEMTARRMCIDPVQWGPQGPTLAGPTWQDATLPKADR